MQELIYKDNIASVRDENERFTSGSKPYLSFEFEELFFTAREAFYVLRGVKHSLEPWQKEEIAGFIDSLVCKKENIRLTKAIDSLEAYLKQTDKSVLVFLERGEEIPGNLKERREDVRAKIKELGAFL
ncbi:MAG: hypothetical protein FP820_09825 [Sulfurimonas sp.]|nr:hypothetical protein [Sulfurimonas sp.]MBU1216059.1 hypothetical protein [bacterium]MBU1434365.1 hypothetical protein [bacterium]MBU1501943.1 hypothetical protein [bacterium]MBU3939574.1 hypothetical protein [bacterium]